MLISHSNKLFLSTELICLGDLRDFPEVRPQLVFPEKSLLAEPEPITPPTPEELFPPFEDEFPQTCGFQDLEPFPIDPAPFQLPEVVEPAEPVRVEESVSTEDRSSSRAKMQARLRTRSKNLLRKDLIEKKVIRNLLKVSQVYFGQRVGPKNASPFDALVRELRLFLAEHSLPLVSWGQAIGELASLIFSSRAKKFIRGSSELSSAEKDEAMEAGDRLKTFKASMKVEERELLFGSPVVVIGRRLYEARAESRQVFEESASISKAGHNNSDLLCVYEEAMAAKVC